MRLLAHRRVTRVVVAIAVAFTALGAVQTAAPQPAAAACDASSLSAAQLTSVFANPGVGGGAGYAGGDYQRVYPLPDGRKLWLFQDMFFSADNDLRDSLDMAAHNAGLVQNGTCWSIVGGPRMNNFIGSAQTTPLRRWFWPMDGEIGHDGALWIFMAEMYNPNGTGATWGAAPVGTWVARIDPSSLAVLSFAPARDGSNRMYGWSVTSDDDYTYLYGHCYRQFVNVANSTAQFDSACMPHTYLARVPKGRFDLMPNYWNGGNFTPNPFIAKPLMTRGAANPMDVQRFGDVYVNVTKIDDWWGAWVYVDKAPNPWGPWENDQSIWIVNDRRCGDCGIYHAHLLPYLDSDGKMVLSWSNGAPFHLWQANAYLYRPTFRTVNLPTFRTDTTVADAGMQPRAPVRAIDTRNTAQRMKGGTMLKVPLASFVAANAIGVVANLTAVNPAGHGFLTTWPCGARMPETSALNFRGARNTANALHTRLGPAKELCVYSSVDTDVLVDVTGSYVPSGAVGLQPLEAQRIADTTSGQALAGGSTLVVPVAGVGGVPATNVGSVTVTVTAVDASAYGYLTVWPCNAQRPTVSTLNFVAGDTIANSATLPLGTAGDVCVFASVTSDVTVDVAGWWGTGQLRATLGSPQRLFDSRSGAKPVTGNTTVVALAPLPAGTSAVMANVAAVYPENAGQLTAWSCAATRPAPSLVYASGENRAGAALSSLSAADELCLHTSAPAHLLIDVTVSFS